MSRRIQMMCAWSGLAFAVLYGLAFVVIARFIPPPSPSWSAERIDALFIDHATSIRIGMVLAIIFVTLLFPYFTFISVQIGRIERSERGAPPVMAIMQFGAAVLLIVFFVLCSMLWITATFRAELEPSVTRMLSDLGWLSFVMIFPGYVLQLGCIGVASLMDRSADPIWPRWAGYLNLWVALGGAGGGIAVFFKSGPFAWNGVVGIYIPLGAFAIWLPVMTYLMVTWLKRQSTGTQVGVNRPLASAYSPAADG